MGNVTTGAGADGGATTRGGGNGDLGGDDGRDTAGEGGHAVALDRGDSRGLGSTGGGSDSGGSGNAGPAGGSRAGGNGAGGSRRASRLNTSGSGGRLDTGRGGGGLNTSGGSGGLTAGAVGDGGSARDDGNLVGLVDGRVGTVLDGGSSQAGVEGNGGDGETHFECMEIDYRKGDLNKSEALGEKESGGSWAERMDDRSLESDWMQLATKFVLEERRRERKKKATGGLEGLLYERGD